MVGCALASVSDALAAVASQPRPGNHKDSEDERSRFGRVSHVQAARGGEVDAAIVQALQGVDAQVQQVQVV